MKTALIIFALLICGLGIIMLIFELIQIWSGKENFKNKSSFIQAVIADIMVIMAIMAVAFVFIRAISNIG